MNPNEKEKDHESVQVQIPLLFYFCTINIVFNLLFMPKSMVTKQFNLGYSMF